MRPPGTGQRPSPWLQPAANSKANWVRGRKVKPDQDPMYRPSGHMCVHLSFAASSKRCRTGDHEKIYLCLDAFIIRNFLMFFFLCTLTLLLYALDPPVSPQ